MTDCRADGDDAPMLFVNNREEFLAHLHSLVSHSARFFPFHPPSPHTRRRLQRGKTYHQSSIIIDIDHQFIVSPSNRSIVDEHIEFPVGIPDLVDQGIDTLFIGDVQLVINQIRRTPSNGRKFCDSPLSARNIAGGQINDRMGRGGGEQAANNPIADTLIRTSDKDDLRIHFVGYFLGEKRVPFEIAWEIVCNSRVKK